MPRSHWLDPLARRVLEATGQIPRKPTPSELRPSVAVPEPPSWTIDVNRASETEWQQLPGCSQDMAVLLVRLQRGGVQFASAEDLIRLLELPSDLARLWQPHLIFHWYGDAPPEPETISLDLNNAAPAELQSLDWPEQRLQGFLRERRLQSFRDLADLQERLALPADAIEALIGRVCFKARRPSPSLPPRRG
ncbi:MAG: hypothetical protein CMN91_10235 [Synechococcus sp. ARS1019]|nr:hypothetical protein [Synechococcus sp. ARS1019]